MNGFYETVHFDGLPFSEYASTDKLHQVSAEDLGWFDQLPRVVREKIVTMPFPPPSIRVFQGYLAYGLNFVLALCDDDINAYFNKFEQDTGVELDREPLKPTRLKRTYR